MTSQSSKDRAKAREGIRVAGGYAYRSGIGLRDNPYHPTNDDSAHWRDGWQEAQAKAAEAEKEAEAEARINGVVDAIEAFIDAKIRYAASYATSGPEWVSNVDVTETREHLRDKLAELAP